MSLSLKEALQNAGIRQSVKKTVYTREEVLARMDELDAEMGKTRNLHNILEALDDAIVAVRYYVRNEQDETNKGTVLLNLDKRCRKIYTVLAKVLQAFINRKDKNDDVVYMKFGEYVAYGAVCTVTKEPKFDIKKTIVGKKTRAFIVTLRNIKQDLTPEMVDVVYLKGTRTDEELYAKLVLPVVEAPTEEDTSVSTEEAKEPTETEEPVKEEVVKPIEVPTEVESPVDEAKTAEVSTEAEVIDTTTNTEQEE
jgi:hypothetical protein|nr:MAG TPA: hypothetical protein [Caudoviricetes sp.]